MNNVRSLNYTIKDTDLLLDDAPNQYVLRIRDLPQEDKPREKLISLGVKALSVNELLAIILAVGTKKEGVLSVSSRLIKEYGEKGIVNETEPKKMALDANIPLTKACQIVACFELGKRFFKKPAHNGAVIRSAKDVFNYVKDMRDLTKEQLRGIYLNSHYQVMHSEVISLGSLTANIVHPREFFKPAFEYSAAAAIAVHNHPSGIANPSEADIKITEQFKQAGHILGIDFLDHVIIAKNKFISLTSLKS